ncbi:MAG: transcription antitermination factor NusB [Polyangiales bacterium]
MGARTGGRAIALQMLYGLDAAGSRDAEARPTLDVDAMLLRYWRAFEDSEAQNETVDPESRAFAETLVRALLARLDAVDTALRAASTHWRLERMPRVDRNVARIGAFELVVHRDTPRAVAIDEAVELGKRFGGDETAKFVNGVLERVADAARPDEPRASQPSSGPKGGGGKRRRG